MIEIQVLESFFLLCMHKNYIPCVCVHVLIYYLRIPIETSLLSPRKKDSTHTHTHHWRFFSFNLKKMIIHVFN